LPGFRGAHHGGYLEAMDFRFVAGDGFATPGPAVVWGRPKIPLIPDEELSPMCRALLIADSGSGVSATLDPLDFLFINRGQGHGPGRDHPFRRRGPVRHRVADLAGRAALITGILNLNGWGRPH